MVGFWWQSVDGVDVELGLTTPNVLESRVNRAMVRAAKRVIAVCDSTKFARRSLSRIVPPSAINQVITDENVTSRLSKHYRVKTLRSQ
jgi:DeoR family transcriptional regulator, aga operon transcriptional repressor